MAHYISYQPNRSVLLILTGWPTTLIAWTKPMSGQPNLTLAHSGPDFSDQAEWCACERDRWWLLRQTLSRESNGVGEVSASLSSGPTTVPFTQFGVDLWWHAPSILRHHEGTRGWTWARRTHRCVAVKPAPQHCYLVAASTQCVVDSVPGSTQA
jgi:hypothetical protein